MPWGMLMNMTIIANVAGRLRMEGSTVSRTHHTDCIEHKKINQAKAACPDCTICPPFVLNPILRLLSLAKRKYNGSAGDLDSVIQAQPQPT
mmetsp:Transcript_29033/g.85931  ORF Transcript_29033/g.85931 Transcript_29033/m.85931 type:complete len:91 (-) Transcript_29033:17-289(-)